ncbi:MAG: hypothetical protein ABEH38_04755 [Flavobacteriales bacterium]
MHSGSFFSSVLISLLLVGQLLFPSDLIAQDGGSYLPNPSLEGEPREDEPPPDWEPCKENSTPDTQPGFWEVTQAPSEGESYVGLVTRGDLGPYAKATEDVGTELREPLRPDSCYRLLVDLSLSKEQGHTIGFGSSFLSYDTSAILKIWGGGSFCEKRELLGELGPVDDSAWKTYELIIRPEKAIFFLSFEADHKRSPEYFGNILMDHIRIGPLKETLRKMDTTVRK